ncbi:MAG: DUF4919 domain-containing protein [Muribaculaceae bacterium]|jgi:hypothetical protein|nr:DUF4919 domain-containing protein [Muribaculaceae bacterium]
MKRIIYALIFTLTVCLAVDAAAPKKLEVRRVDFEEIRKSVQDTVGGTHYYPRLMAAYLRNDSTLLNDTLPSGEVVQGRVMNIDDYRKLYYGYVFEEDYNPFRTSVYSEKLEHLYDKKEFTREESVLIKENARAALADNLFDLRQMSFFIYALKEIRKDNLARICQFRLNYLVAAILSSGQGTKEHPWVVTSVEHEYNIINFLGYVAVEHEVVEGNIDYIKVAKKDEKSPEGFYFDVSKIMEVAQVKFPDAKE